VTTQNSNAIYCYEHLTHLSVLRSNYIKNQNINSLNAYYKELLEFQTLMEKSMKYVINIQQKIVNLQTFIDLNLKKNILNFGNYELTRYIRPNLNGVDLVIIRPSSVDAEVKGDLLVSLDKKKSLKDYLEDENNCYLNLKDALSISIDNQKVSQKKALDVRLTEGTKNEDDSFSKLKELQKLDIDLSNMDIRFAINTNELDFMDKNLDSVSSLSEVCIKTNEAVLILSSFL